MQRDKILYIEISIAIMQLLCIPVIFCTGYSDYDNVMVGRNMSH